MPENRIDGEAITDSEFDYTPDWYARLMVGGMSIIGLSSLALRMGGPTGKAIKQAISRQVDYEAGKIVQKEQPIPINLDVSLQHEIVTDEKTYTPGVLPSLEEIKEIETNFLTTSQSKINKIKALENAVNKLIASQKNGDSLFSQLRIIELTDMSYFYGKGNTSTKMTLGSLSSKTPDFITMATKIAALKEYIHNDMRAEDVLDQFDYFDPELLKKASDADINHINMVNQNLYETNSVYADEYIHQFEKVLKDLKNNSIAFSNMPLVNPHIIGDVGAPFKTLINENFSLINHSQDLFVVQDKNGLSSQVVKNEFNGQAYKIIDKAISQNIDFKKYEGKIGRIANLLETIARNNSKAVKGVSIKLQDFGTSSGHNTYLLINIEREWSGNNPNQHITLKVPIADTHNLTPKINNFAGQSKLGYTVVEGSPGMWELNETTNLTNRYLDHALKTLSNSVGNDLIENEENELTSLEKRWHSGMVAIQDSVSSATGESRDIFKHTSVGMLVYDEYDMLSAGGKRQRMTQLHSGVNTMLNMSRLNKHRNNGNLRVITLDLETLQLFGESSPREMAGNAAIGMWSVGVKVSDGRGNTMQDNTLGGHAQFVSDHALKEHKIRNLQSEGKLLSAVANDGAVRKYAQFAKKNYGDKVNSAGDLGLVEALEAWIADVDDQAKRSMSSGNHYNSSMLGISSSVDFAHRTIDMLVKLCNEMRAQGHVPIINMANGTSFDGEVLNMLTGRLHELKGSADFVDVTDLSRALKLGKSDVTGDQLHSIANDMVLKNGVYTQGDLDFKHKPKEAIRALSAGGVLKASHSKDLFGLLEGVVGPNAAAHNASLLDVYLTDLSLHMAWDLYNKDETLYMRKAASVITFMDQTQSRSYGKALSDQLSLMGLEVNGMALDRAGLSAKNLDRILGSTKSIAEIMPYHSMNPHGKQLHQLGRHGYNKRLANAPKHRYMTAMTTQAAQDATEFGYRTAGMDRNIYANKVQAKAFYTIGEYGTNEGHLSVSAPFAEEFNNNMHHTKRFELDLSTLDGKQHGAGTHADLMSFLSRAYNRTKSQVEMNGNQLTGAVFQDAIREELNEIALKGGSINLDPSNPITSKYLLGPNKVNLTEHGIGKLVGVSLGGDPKNGSVSKLMFEFMFAASLNHGVIGNTAQGKSVVHISNRQEIFEMGPLKGQGLFGSQEMQTGLDMVNKGFVGTLKATILQDSIMEFSAIITDKTRSMRERKDAKRKLKQYMADLSETTGDIEHKVNHDGTVMLNPKTKNLGPVALTTAVSKVSMSQVLESRSLLGGDKIHTMESMQLYYSMFGGELNTTANGSIFTGRHFVNSIIKGEASAADNSTSESMIKMMGSLRNTTDDFNEMEKHIDPMRQAVEYLLNDKDRGITTEREAMSFLANKRNRKEVDDLLKNHIKIPRLFEVCYDMNRHDNQMLGLKAIGEVVFNKADAEVVKQVNKEVHFKHSYFDNLLSSHYIPDHFKDLLVTNRGITKNNLNLKTAKTFASVFKIMKNNSMADVMKYSPNLEQLQKIIDKPETMARLQRMLDDIDDSNPQKAMYIEKALDEMRARGLIITDQERDIIAAANLKEQQAILKGKLDSKTVISGFDIQEMLKLGHHSEKLGAHGEGIFILPGRTSYTTKNGTSITEMEANKLKASGIEIFEKRDEFRINIDRAARRNSHQNNPFDLTALKDFAEKHQRDAELAGTWDPKKAMIRYVDDGMGNREIIMGGALMAMPNDPKAYKNAYGLKTDGLGMTNEHYRNTILTFEAYHAYYKETNEKKRAELGTVFLQNHMKYMNTLMRTDKDSLYADSIQGTTLHGIRQQYDVIDKSIMNARELYDGKGNLSKTGSETLEAFFKEHTMDVNAQKQMKNELHFAAHNATASTVFMSHEDMFNNTTKYNVKGGTLTFDEMLNKARKRDKKLYEHLMEAKKGKASLAAGMNRFPTGPNGELGVLSLDAFGMSVNSRRFLGLEQDRSYGFSEFCNLLNADTDGDQTELMMIGYHTYQHFNDYKEQHNLAKQGIFQHQDVLAKFSGYNEKGYILGVTGATKNRSATYRVGQVMANGSIGEMHMSAEEYHEKFNKSVLSTTVKNIIGPEFATKNFMHSIPGAVEKHYATMQVASFSAGIIGLVTNSVRNSLADIHMLNKLAPQADFTRLFGTVESGFGAIAQLPILMNKHTNIEDAFRLTDVMAYFSDPTKATTGQYTRARDYLEKEIFKEGKYSEEHRQQQLNLFDSFRSGKGLLGMVEAESPEYAKYVKQVRARDVGSESSNYMQVINNKLFEESPAIKLSNMVSDHGKKSMEVALNALVQTEKGTFDHAEFLDNNRNLFEDNSIQKGIDRKFNSMITEKLLQGKGGRFMAGAGIAAVGLGLFAPMAGTGVTKTNSDNNLFANEMELGRGIPLNQINASFSKQAFMYNADMDTSSNDKKNKGAMLNGLIDNSSVLMQHQTVHTGDKLDIRRYNTMGYIGPMGNSNYTRGI